MKRLVFFALIINASFPAWGEAPSLPKGNRYRVEVDRVKDGDTIKGTVFLGFDVALVDKDIRLTGFDAWENTRRRRTVTITAEELAKGREARKALDRLLGKGAIYLLPEGQGKDPYGRLVGRLVVVPPPPDKEIDAAQWMRQRGHHRGNK